MDEKAQISAAARSTQTLLTVHELYASVQGEALHAGLPCVFVRTSGCNLRCSWCDTTEAFSGGQSLTVSQIVEQVRAFNLPAVQLTGGEPLIQKNIQALVNALLECGLTVLIETGGSKSIAALPEEAHIILDVKAPASGEEAANFLPNLELYRPNMQYKFVLLDRNDFEFMLDIYDRYDLASRGIVWASPVHGRLDPAVLSDWLVKSGRNIRLNLQLHKYIWGADCTGV